MEELKGLDLLDFVLQRQIQWESLLLLGEIMFCVIVGSIRSFVVGTTRWAITCGMCACPHRRQLGNIRSLNW